MVMFRKTMAGSAMVLGWMALWASAALAETAAYSPFSSEVDDGVVLAGTLDLAALRASHEGTIRVIDLRTEPEGTPVEAAAAADLGMVYTNIPVAGASIDPVQVGQLRDALSPSASEDLVIVHCASGNRAGMLWGAMLLEEGVPLTEVEEKVAGVVTKAPITGALEAYSKSLESGQ